MPKNDDPVDDVTAEDMLDLDDGSAPRPPADLMAAMDDAEEARLHPLLTNAEFRAAEKKAKDRLLKEQKTAAMAAVEKETLEAIRGREGLVTGDAAKDELIDVHLDLYEGADHIMLSGVRYDHGRTRRVPRHIADTLREIAARGHNHQTELDGKGIAGRQTRQGNTTLNARTGAVQVVH